MSEDQVQINFRGSAALKEAIDRRAKESRLSAAEWCRRALEAAVEVDQRDFEERLAEVEARLEVVSATAGVQVSPSPSGAGVNGPTSGVGFPE